MNGEANLVTALFVLELIGVAAFAIAGALKAIQREMDIFGILVLAAITALGGGIIRDLLADRFPASLDQPVYFAVAIIGGLLAAVGAGFFTRYQDWLKIFDALGLAIFAVLGANVALNLHLNVLSILLFGLLTGIGGGVVRDLLANEVPLVLRQEVYALAALIGITIQWALVRLGLPPLIAALIGALGIFLIRLAAIRWNLNLPRVK
ncbi:MAG TPA: trimeric intracellular cation channel family protein [Armatimonadota bacterium]|nr:trimeric intracellular cation channel family protein [Armatimonadota bacterium]HOS43169.1 trimeric intracellular cation channel family protein [Armatimonadota bacterium]